MITTPRKWTKGETVQICVFAPNPTSSENSITVTVKTNDNKEIIVPERIIQIPAGKTELCDKVFVPSLRHRDGKLIVTGTLGGKSVSHEKRISLADSITKTFIQTDKFLYKPGQEVQFRILTLNGPFLKISTEKYPLMWVETPSGSRVAQWTNVENPSGLIHESFKLSDEPEEGPYKITVRTPGEGNQVSQTFKVEEYVLPRFEIKVNAPKFILGTDTSFVFNVCAKYTYGQPVKGNLTLEVDNGGWGSSKLKHVIKEKISGCKDVTVLAEDIHLNGDDYFVYSMTVKATVEEDGTGEEFHGETKVEVQRTALKFKSVGREDYIKPMVPFTGKVKVEWPDGSVAAQELMEVCAGNRCKNITTAFDGILEFVIATYETEYINIKAVNYPRIKSPSSAWRSVMYESSYRHHLKKYFSPSKSSLVIHSPEGRLECHPESPKEYILPVLFSAINQTRGTFSVQVVSRGQIQFSSTEEHELIPTDLPIDDQHLVTEMPSPGAHIRGVINIPIKLPSTASPSAKVVVWYSRDDGEVVSDTQEVEIAKCYSNKVDLKWSRSKVQPGEQATLDLSAEPQSTCSLGVVDKSVELLSSQNDDLTLEKVFEIVEQAMINEWDNPQSNDNEYCSKWNENKNPGPPGPPGPDGPIRPVPLPIPVPFMPEDMSESKQKRSSPWWNPFYSDYVDALKMFDKSGLYFFTDLTTETRPCVERAPVYAYPRSGVVVMHRSKSIGRMEQPMYDIGSVEVAAMNVEGTSTLLEIDEKARTYFPETWLWHLLNTGSSGVSSQELTLPDTITEWVGKAVCVHPEKGLGVSQRAPITTFTPFFIDLTLPPSVKRGEVLPVKISVFNYLDEALPVKVILEGSTEYEILEDPTPEQPQPIGQRSSCIPLQDKVVHTVKIRPLVIGDVNITVGAFVDELYPEVCGPEYVISKRDLLIKPIKVEAEGFPREKTWTKYICSKDIEENADFLERWQIETPPNIVEDSARGWVTAVGDLLGPTLENLGSLVRMPYGCGEQNMLNFAPNIFILQYLDASNQTTPAIAGKAIDFMKQGYQRELKYRHDDGSYSAFGNSDASGSTWLTAFVLKSFAQARQYVQIDGEDLDMSREWLKQKQMENGCFNSVGKVFHKGMKGGIAGDGSPVPLTAYVLISLLEAGEPSTSKTVSEAAFCIHADKSDNPYTLVLKAYALALSGETNAELVVQQMINKAVETSNSMYWELPAGSGMSEAVAVETAGYAILAMMTLDAARYEIQARKVVKWISSQRNGQGGFISTQDTVVALQALATFEAHQNQGAVNLVVTVDGDGLEHSFFIDESNKLLQQMVNIPNIPSSVILGMEGEGCALVQAVLRYNVPDPNPSETFSLTVETETAPDKKCITKRIKTCASYHHLDEKSNMAVIEVNLVSGYIPEKADLKQIVGYGTGLIKRYEVDGSKVTFYIDEFSKADICLEFRMLREVDVEDVKPGTVKVYDYYEPEFTISKSYTLPPNDDCDFGPIFVIEGIIEGPIDYEYDPEVNMESTVSPDAIDDLIGALDAIP